MKRRMWILGWLAPLAILIVAGLGAFAQSQPASDPSATLGAGAAGALLPSQPAGGGADGGPSQPAGAENASLPTTGSQPGMEEDVVDVEPDGMVEAGSQPTSGPGATSGPTSRAFSSSRPAGRGTAFSRPAGGFPTYGNNTNTRTRGGGNNTGGGNTRTGRTRGGADAAPTPPPVFGPSTAWENFSQVATRNIFIKDRSVRIIPDFVPRPLPPMRVTGLILTGIVLVDANQPQNSDRMAFLEDAETGRLARATTGQVLDGGRVLAVSLNGIQYDKSGVRRWVALGQALTGGRIDLATQPTIAPPEIAGATTTSGPSEGGAESVLDRMRRRAQMERK